MTPIEIIALIFVLLGFFKIIITLFNPYLRLKLVRKLAGNKEVTTIVLIVVALVILKYLLQEINIVQIMAVGFFMSLLIMINMIPIIDDLLKPAEKIIMDKKWLRKLWLSVLIWIGLFVWVIWELIRQIP